MPIMSGTLTRRMAGPVGAGGWGVGSGEWGVGSGEWGEPMGMRPGTDSILLAADARAPVRRHPAEP